MKNILDQFPPSTENNARSIVRGKIDKFEKCHSDMMANEIENLTGWRPDWSDGDVDGQYQRGQWL